MELLVLGLVATIGFASYALWSKARADETPTPPLPELESHERTLQTLQVSDVVEHLGGDWLVEGVLQLSEEGRAARLYRLADGAAERYLFAAGDEGDPLWLEKTAISVEGTPETLLYAGDTYSLKTRASGAVVRAGTVGDRRGGERLTVVEYAAGASRLLLLAWTDRGEVFAGERASAHLFDLLPGK